MKNKKIFSLYSSNYQLKSVIPLSFIHLHIANVFLFRLFRNILMEKVHVFAISNYKERCDNRIGKSLFFSSLISFLSIKSVAYCSTVIIRIDAVRTNNRHYLISSEMETHIFFLVIQNQLKIIQSHNIYSHYKMHWKRLPFSKSEFIREGAIHNTKCAR